ncbi:MAG: hypothetical protein ACK4RK_05000 [Gemmataceae bacterium]
MSTIALGAILGFLVWMYAAHCLLVVVETTAAGGDEVEWPDEPFTDWVWKAIYVLWIAGVWLVPVGLLLRGGMADRPVAWGSGLVLVFWLTFPVSLLSALGSNNPWVAVLRPAVLRRMRRKWGLVAIYYAVSGILLAAAAGCVIITLRFDYRLIPFGGLGLATWFLMYARLLGKLGWVLYPRLPAGADEGPLAPPKPKREPSDNGNSPPQRIHPAKHRPPRPRWVFAEGVFLFPWYYDSLAPWLWLTAGFSVMLGLGYVVILLGMGNG